MPLWHFEKPPLFHSESPEGSKFYALFWYNLPGYNFHIFAGCRAADLLQRFFERYFYHRLRIDLIRSDLEIRESRIQVIVEADNGNVPPARRCRVFPARASEGPAVRSQLQTNASGICSGR